MTRKDYILLAAAFAASQPNDPAEYNGWAAAVVAVADALETDNPRFDRQRFLFAAVADKENAK